MRSVEITDVAGCMRDLLLRDTFDKFPLSEATITMMATYTIDGHLVRGFYSEEEWGKLSGAGYSCIPYGHLRKVCLEMIHGRKTPVSFRFVFLAPPALIAQLAASSGSSISAEGVEALAMNLNYRDGKLTLTTGSSMRVFSMDRSIDRAWDAWVPEFLSRSAIQWSELF